MPLRSFVGIQPPKELLRSIQTAIEKSGLPKESVRWTRTMERHFTLKYLDTFPPEKKTFVQSVMREAVSSIQTFDIEIDRIDFFENAHGPLIIWMGVEKMPRAFFSMVDVLNNELEKKGFLKATRAMIPHLTLCRLKERGQKDLYLEKLHKAFQFPLPTFKVSAISLHQRELQDLNSSYFITHTEFLNDE